MPCMYVCMCDCVRVCGGSMSHIHVCMCDCVRVCGGSMSHICIYMRDFVFVCGGDVLYTYACMCDCVLYVYTHIVYIRGSLTRSLSPVRFCICEKRPSKETEKKDLEKRHI